MQDRISHTAALAESDDTSSLDQSADSIFTNLNDYPNTYGTESEFQQSTPSDITPGLPLSAKGMLIVYTCINLLSYFDRGALSGMLEDISKTFPGTSATLEGLLGAAFMVGFMVASPMFAHSVSYFEPFRVMALGLFIWTLATLLCAIAPSYVVFFIGRILTGFGEASFLCIAPPFIDKFAPPASRGLWLSVFYAAIPVGYALGFIASGIWLDLSPMEGNSWRGIFIFECAMMAPFVLFCLTGKSPYSFADSGKKSTSASVSSINGSEQESTALLSSDLGSADSLDYVLHTDTPAKKSNDGFMHSMHVILLNPIFIFVVLGYAAQNFVTGGFAFFGIEYAKKALGMSKTSAGVYFGLVTILTGIFGTLSGGLITDRMRRKRAIPSAVGYEGLDSFVATVTVALATEQNMTTAAATAEVEGQVEERKNDLTHPSNIRDRIESMLVALNVVTVMTFVALPLCLLAFAFDSPPAFFIFLTLAELLLFCCFSPLNNSVMWCVPFKYAPQAMAMSVVFVHLLGDSFSPLLIGAARDATDNNWHLVMSLASSVLVFAVLSWFIGFRYVANLSKPTRSYGYSSIFSAPDYSNWTGTEPAVHLDSSGNLSAESLPEEFSSVRRRLGWSLDDTVKQIEIPTL